MVTYILACTYYALFYHVTISFSTEQKLQLVILRGFFMI